MDGSIRKDFLTDYGRIRKAEGRGCADPAYYRALPFTNGQLPSPLGWQWKIRAATYRCFERGILIPAEESLKRPLRILDAGAGNGWLSNRLAQRGHVPVALDIFNDALDGLEARRHYTTQFAAVEADFDELPFAPGSFDLAIYNSSFHYSPNYHRTLEAVRAVLRPGGMVVIQDTPVYRRFEHGDRMRRERQARFAEQYGFRSEALGSIEFLDEGMLANLEGALGIRWRAIQPWLGWKWAARPVKAWLRRERPPSRFLLICGRFAN